MSELEFEEKTHTYKLMGMRIPSVTQVLEPLEDFSGIDPDVLETARVFGTHVHDACALMLKVKLNWSTLDPSLIPYVTAARDFIRERKLVVLNAEERMHEPDLRFAGTIDLFASWHGKLTIFDWKSATSMPRSAALQTAGYSILMKKTFAIQKLHRAGVLLRPDGTYKIYEFKDRRDHNWFLSALNLWHWRNLK